MSYLDVYIGDLDDPDFHWEGGDWSGNVPSRLSPFFPYGSQVQRIVIERIDAGVYDGKQTDWGAHVARVTQGQIKELVKELYASDAVGLGSADVPDLLHFVNRLDPHKLHALVCTEL